MHQTIVEFRLSVSSKETAVRLISAMQSISSGTTPDHFKECVETVARIVQGNATIMQATYRDRTTRD